jgi:hypothetical protein
LEAQQGLQPLVRACGAIRKADSAEMPKELKTIVSEDVDVTVDDYEVYSFTHGDDDVLPHTDNLEDMLISYLPIPVDGGGQPMSSQGEGQHHSNLEAQQQAGDCPPTDPSQRIITTRTSCNVGKIINMCLVMSRSHGVKSI